jgi:urease gamma subunit
MEQPSAFQSSALQDHLAGEADHLVAPSSHLALQAVAAGAAARAEGHRLRLQEAVAAGRVAVQQGVRTVRSVEVHWEEHRTVEEVRTVHLGAVAHMLQPAATEVAHTLRSAASVAVARHPRQTALVLRSGATCPSGVLPSRPGATKCAAVYQSPSAVVARMACLRMQRRARRVQASWGTAR